MWLVVRCHILSQAFLNSTPMSLVPGYSSDEDNGPSSPTADVFGLSQIPAAKKIRVDEAGFSLKPQAAPHVLAEVGYSLSINYFYS